MSGHHEAETKVAEHANLRLTRTTLDLIMYNFRHALQILVAAAALACLTPRHVMAEPIRDTEIEVYAAYINHFASELPANKSLVVEPKTALLTNAFDANAVSKIEAQLPEASKAVIADLVRVGENSVSLDISQRLVRQEIRYAMADEKFLREIFDNGSLTNAWNRFYKTYPTATGLVRFSRVGIDAEKKQALLYVEHACGGLCGNGFLILFQLQWGRWEVVRSEHLWVS